MLKKILKTLTLLVVSASFSHAAIVWQNSIAGNDPGLTNPFTAGQTLNPSLTVSGIGRGAGIAGNVGDDRYNASGWNTASIDLTAYFTFTLTPTLGQKIDFTSFGYNGVASGTGPTNFAFKSSVDGFASSIGTANETGTTISLAGASYQNITGAIEFRFYAWGASAGAGTYSVDDFTFNGSVSPIPEPATGAMLLGGIGAVLLLRRRRLN